MARVTEERARSIGAKGSEAPNVRSQSYISIVYYIYMVIRVVYHHIYDCIDISRRPLLVLANGVGRAFSPPIDIAMSTFSSKGVAPDGRIRLEVNLGVQMPLSGAVGEVRSQSNNPAAEPPPAWSVLAENILLLDVRRRTSSPPPASVLACYRAWQHAGHSASHPKP